jgi:hypothetical protein
MTVKLYMDEQVPRQITLGHRTTGVIMLKDITHVQALPNYHLHLRFEDDIEGTIDLTQIIPFSGIFTPLKDHAYFATVQVNPELGTIVWANGADLDPDVLYSLITQQPIPDFTALQTA